MHLNTVLQQIDVRKITISALHIKTKACNNSFGYMYSFLTFRRSTVPASSHGHSVLSVYSTSSRYPLCVLIAPVKSDKPSRDDKILLVPKK